MAEKGVQVSATVPREWDDILEDHKWDVRKTKTKVIYTAVQEYLVKRNLIEDPDGIVEENHGGE